MEKKEVELTSHFPEEKGALPVGKEASISCANDVLYEFLRAQSNARMVRTSL